MSTVPIRAISVFYAAARVGSITKAADELGVTPSAVSQQVRALEAQIGTALMAKSGRGVVLTEAGQRYFDRIADGFERIGEATEEIRGVRSVTTLVVRATPTLSSKWLLPRLRGFLDAHPHILLRLDATTEMTGFGREAVDLEIRHGDGRYPGLYVEGLAEERFLPACAPFLHAAESVAIANLPRERLIQSVKAQMQWPRWFALAGVNASNWRRVLFDRSHMAIDAAADGIGIALESDLMMWKELATGRLVCPVPAPPAVTLTTQWIVCPHEHLRQSKIRAFLAWIRAERDKWAESVKPR